MTEAEETARMGFVRIAHNAMMARTRPNCPEDERKRLRLIQIEATRSLTRLWPPKDANGS